jgi:uncharacterized membrane protein
MFEKIIEGILAVIYVLFYILMFAFCAAAVVWILILCIAGGIKVTLAVLGFAGFLLFVGWLFGD